MRDSGQMSSIPAARPKLCVLGMGHVGLPTALGMAELGWVVVGVDSDAAKMALLRAGKIPFYEPGLRELLDKHLKSGRFRPTEDVEAGIRSASVLFVCVGTPQRESGEADLTQVENVVQTIARNFNGYKLIVEKSTVPAVTAQWIKRTIRRYAKTERPTSTDGSTTDSASNRGRVAGEEPAEFDVAANPEFLQEGIALKNFFHPHCIVCGVESERAREILAEIYRPLNAPLLVTDLNTAEIIKHAANAFLATKVSFINMVADLCEPIGADITKVAQGIGLDPRIGSDFLRAGIGFGGYCLPKDLRAFIHLAEKYRVDFSLLQEVGRINQRRVDLFLDKVRQALWVLHGKTIGILGLAFKPATDDIREAPSAKIIERLLREDTILQVHDPQAMSNMRQMFPEEAGRLLYCVSPYEAARGAHALLLLTEWGIFGQLDLRRLRNLMEVPILVDGRNLFNPEEARQAGFEYFSIGRTVQNKT